jgi:hypothetical protein
MECFVRESADDKLTMDEWREKWRGTLFEAVVFGLPWSFGCADHEIESRRCDRFHVDCDGLTCELPEEQYRFLQILVQEGGLWVEYVDIADWCMNDIFASGESIRALKGRLLRSLKKAGMDGLAASIVTVPKGEMVRLEIPVGSRVAVRYEPPCGQPYTDSYVPTKD